MLPVALYPVGSAVKLFSALDGAVITHSTSLHWDALLVGLPWHVAVLVTMAPFSPALVLIPWGIFVALGIPPLPLLSLQDCLLSLLS